MRSPDRNCSTSIPSIRLAKPCWGSRDFAARSQRILEVADTPRRRRSVIRASVCATRGGSQSVDIPETARLPRGTRPALVVGNESETLDDAGVHGGPRDELRVGL